MKGDEMKKVQRFDSVRIKAHFDDNGFLVDTPIVARIGLQVYQTPTGGERREFRPASEVFKSDSLATYQGKPITLGHVTVNSGNAKDVVVGACAGIGKRDGIGVAVPVTVYADEAIDKAKKKIASELSVGYTSVDIEEPGWGNNETGEYVLDKDVLGDKTDSADDYPPAPDNGSAWVRFDALQTNIEVNHVALVFRGRAGIAKLNLDSEQENPYIDSEPTNRKKDSKMKTIKIDGVDVEVSDAVLIHVTALTKKADEAATELSTVTAARDQLQVKVDGIPKAIEEAVAAAVTAAKADAVELADLVTFANELSIKTDGLDSKAIKIACIKELSGIDASAKDDAYINTSFEFARESDKMAANRTLVDGKPVKADKAESAAIPDPMSRFRNPPAAKK